MARVSMIRDGMRRAIRLTLRLLPLTWGVRLCVCFPCLIYQLPPGRQTFAEGYCGRFRAYADTTYFIDRCLLANCFEPPLLAAIGAFVTDGDTVIDVGANVGAAVLPAAHAVGILGQVIAFEPRLAIEAYLRDNAAQKMV